MLFSFQRMNVLMFIILYEVFDFEMDLQFNILHEGKDNVQLAKWKKCEVLAIAEENEIQKDLNNLFLNASAYKEKCLNIQKVV